MVKAAQGPEKNGTKGMTKKRGFVKGTELGQAPALSRGLWKEWLEWLKMKCGPRIYMVVMTTQIFGLRCGEAVTLKAEDLQVQHEIPRVRVSGDTVGGRKSPGDVYIRKQHIRLIKDIVKNGIKVTRKKKHKHGKGKSKLIDVTTTFKLPEKGYLFKSRRNAQRGHLHYHAVWAAVRKEAPKFLEHLKRQGKAWGPEIARLRPHSGRATLITELMGEGMTTAMSMKYARHAPGSLKVHLKYSRLTLEDVKAACDRPTHARICHPPHKPHEPKTNP